MKQNYFELFGLTPSYPIELNLLNEKRQQLLQQFHPDRFTQATPQEKRLAVQLSALINDAYETLLDPIKRAAYLLSLQNIEVDFENNTAMPAEFLLKQMDWHEKMALAEDEFSKELVANELHQKFIELENELTKVFANQEWQQAKELTRQLKFYERLLKH